MPSNPKCWVRCRDCGHREMIRRSCFERAARPRCCRCGGPVEASKSARASMTRGMDYSRQLKERRV
jgi:ribosomal protein S27E